MNHLPQISSPFVNAEPPSWASGYGLDEYGYYAELAISSSDLKLVQRFRWIPAGEFMMGSLGNGRGRSASESMHRVRLSTGFWMAETTCAQSFWTAVMGENPSRFTGEDLPVEKVSYEDALRFLDRLNGMVSGGDFRLPSEAEWEYSCRAGTQTPFSFGETIDTQQVNFYGNHRYLESEAKEEYRQKTVPPKSLPCNAWGLFAVHGNVWEWCYDWYGDYEKRELSIDPFGSDSGSNRVVRGGSWINSASNTRSAYRYRYSPGGRYDNLGFRFLSSAKNPEQSDSESTNKRAEVAAAEQGPKRTRFGDGNAKQTVDLSNAEKLIVDVPFETRRIVRTNLAEVELSRMSKPKWATDFGRDQYGVYVEFEVRSVRQRMRWVPPGQFERDAGNSGADNSYRVTISCGFWMFETLCTETFCKAALNTEYSIPDPRSRPTTSISYLETLSVVGHMNNWAISNALTLKFSLPTEAQWEHACWVGARKSKALENSGECDSLGLFDMRGSIGQWCADWYVPYGTAHVSDPQGPTKGIQRVVRGGNNATGVAIAPSFRNSAFPKEKSVDVGFRLVATTTETAD